MEPNKKDLALRQQSEQEKELVEVQYQAKEADLQLSADILATERSLATKEHELIAAMGAFPFNSANIISLQVDVEGLKDGLTRLNKLKTDLF